MDYDAYRQVLRRLRDQPSKIMGSTGNLPEISMDKSHQSLKYADSICYHKQKYADEVRVYGKTISQKCKTDRKRKRRA